MILDIDYVVSEDQEILIVDQFTGRWKDVVILMVFTKRSKPKKVFQFKKKLKHLMITYQNLFRMYASCQGWQDREMKKKNSRNL